MQRIVVVQRNGKGEGKVAALRERGRGLTITEVLSVDGALPQIIDDPESYLPEGLDADLVLSFLGHPDLEHHLARLCRREHIPMVASGRRIDVEGVITPPT